IQLDGWGNFNEFSSLLYEATVASGRTWSIVLSLIFGKLFSTLYPFLLFLIVYLSVTPFFKMFIVLLQVSYTSPFKSAGGILQNLTPLNISSFLPSSKITIKNLALDKYSYKSDSSHLFSIISLKSK